jgi:small-conductance mechanosensitive channel
VKRSQLPKNMLKKVTSGILLIWAALIIIWFLEAVGLTSVLSSLTLSGIVGLGITLGLQSTLSNIIGGIFLLQENVLRLGDMIKFSGIEGEVVKLGFRTTWLKTNEGEIAIVSNSSLSSGPFINYTAKERLSKNITQRLEEKLKKEATTKK